MKGPINIVDEIIKDLEENFSEILEYKPRFNIYQLSNQIYNINYYRRNFSFNFDMIFPPEGFKPYVYIIKLEVVPQGTGKGTRLMEEFIQSISTTKTIDEIYLTSINEKAEKFWANLGFQPLKESLIDPIVVNKKHLEATHICRANMVFIIK